MWNAEVFDEGSIFSINEGRISNLAVQINDDWTFNCETEDRTSNLKIKPLKKLSKYLLKNINKRGSQIITFHK